MKPKAENERPESHNLSRREMLGLIGATGAASLVGGAGQQSAGDQMSKSTQNPKRGVRVDAKTETINIDIGKTAVIVVDMQDDLRSQSCMVDRAGPDNSMNSS